MFIRGMVEIEECGPPFLPQSFVCVFDGTSKFLVQCQRNS